MLNPEEMTKWTSSETLAHERHLIAGWIIIPSAQCFGIYKAFAYFTRCHEVFSNSILQMWTATFWNLEIHPVFSL